MKSRWKDGAPGGGVPLRRVVPSRGIHRDQPGDRQPGGGAVLQQAWNRRAMDQRRQAGSEDDAALLPSVPLEPSPAGIELLAYNLGNLWAAAGTAEKDRELVADEFAA